MSTRWWGETQFGRRVLAMSRKLAGAWRVVLYLVQKKRFACCCWTAARAFEGSGRIATLGPDCHQASVYLTSTSWSDGNFCFNCSNVGADRVVLLRFNLRRLLRPVTQVKWKCVGVEKRKKVLESHLKLQTWDLFVHRRSYLLARQARPLSVTGVSQRLSTCSLCKCSEMSCRPESPNWRQSIKFTLLVFHHLFFFFFFSI